MAERNQSNTTNYEHPQESNLLNVHKAMEYNSAGEPVLRTTVEGITIEGDVTVDRVKLWDGTNDLLFDRPNNDGETAPWSLPTENHNMVFNGSTWDRMRGNINDGVLVQVSNGSIEIKNDIGNPIPISKNTTVNSTENPIHITGAVDANISGGEVSVVLAGGASKETAFGELYGITITPVIQLDGIYGTTTEVIETFVSGSGATAGGVNGLFSAVSGTTSTGYAALGSKRFLRYRPGQGALARFTAAFSPTVTQTSQRAGLFNRENAIQLGINDDGVNGPRFGVLRASGGKVHITVLTINTAPTGNQTATVTLDGVAFTITGITSGTTTAVAVQVNKIDGFTGWFVDQVDNTVVFSSLSTGPKNGTFSFVSTGAGTLATGTFSTKQTGVNQTQHWTYQEDFNLDTLDGTGNAGNPSGMLLSPEYLNVYQINFRWLGSGEIRYAIEDDSNGNMIFFHHEHYTNRYNVPHTTQPSFRLGYISQNTGSTSSATVTGASMMAAIEGDIRQNELNRSTSVNKTTLAQNVTHHLMTIRNPYVTNGKSGALNGDYVLNAKEIILKDISIATQGNDPSVLFMFFEATSFSGTHSYTSQPKDNGMISTVDGTLDPTVDTAICRFVSAINGQASYPLRDFRVTIPPGASISFAINSSAQISRVTFAAVFSED